MNNGCDRFDRETLRAWADHAPMSDQDRRDLEAHVPSCADCSQVVADLAIYRERMRSFGADTAPAAMPAAVSAAVQAEMDRNRIWSFPRLVWASTAAAVIIVLLGINHYRNLPQYNVQVSEMLEPMDMMMDEPGKLETSDASRAMAHIEANVGEKTPVLQVQSSGLRMMAVTVVNAKLGQVRYDFQAPSKKMLCLMMYLKRGGHLPSGMKMTYRGAEYQCYETGPRAALCWQTGDRTYVVFSEMPPTQLAQYASELRKQTDSRT